MSVDGLTLNAVAAVLNDRLAGAAINDVRWVLPSGIHVISPRGGVVLSAHPFLAGVFPAAGNMSAAAAPEVAKAARRKMRGGRVVGIATDGLERVVRLTMEKTTPAGVKQRYALILEAMARWSNLILVEGDEETVIAALKMIPPAEGRRTVLPGRPYLPPPRDGGRHHAAPHCSEPASLRAEQLVPGDGPPPRRVPNGISAESLNEIIKAFKRRGAPELDAFIESIIAKPPASARIAASGRRPRLLLDFEGRGQDILEAAADFYGRTAASLALEAAVAPVLATLKHELRRRRALREKLEKDMAGAAKSSEYRRWADLIMANLARIPRGAAEFSSDAPFGESGPPVIVRLDPRFSAASNAERLYKKAKKLESGLGHISARLERLGGEIGRLEEMAGMAELARTVSEAQALNLRAAAFLRPAPPLKPAPEAKPKARRPYLEYALERGARALVGKDAASNDYLLGRVARPDDIWLHAEGYPGSHVILKVVGGGEPDAVLLLAAASLAALHSQAKNEAKVSVTYAKRKNVRKPKGAAAGLVVLSRRRALMAPPCLPPNARLKG